MDSSLITNHLHEFFEFKSVGCSNCQVAADKVKYEVANDYAKLMDLVG